MSTNSARYTIALALTGAAVLGAVLVLAWILRLPDVSGGAIALGVAVLAFAAISFIGIWTHRPAVTLIPAVLLVGLGFIGVAIGPQIIGIGVLAVSGALVFAAEHYV